MREFQEKRKFKKIIYSGWLQIFLGIVLLALIFSTVKVYKKSRISADKAEEIKEEMAKLEKRNAELAAEAARLESESGEDGEIRKRFDVAKPGEKILVIVDKNSEDVKINGAENNVGFFPGIWRWIKNWF
jgi:cell division protein FtsB